MSQSSEDKDRPPLPKGYIYSKEGKILSALEQLGNVIDALGGDENFDKACEEEWKELPKDEQNRRLEKVKDTVRKTIDWIEKVEAEKKFRTEGKSRGS